MKNGKRLQLNYGVASNPSGDLKLLTQVLRKCHQDGFRQ